MISGRGAPPNGPVAAMVARAGEAIRAGRVAEATDLLRRLIAAVPDPGPIHLTLAQHLRAAGDPGAALAEIEAIESSEDDLTVRTLRAALLVQLGRVDEALPIFARNATELPRETDFWASYGAALRMAGRLDEAIAAYRHAIAVRPTSGEAWWGLANLKTTRFDTSDISAMRRALRRPKLTTRDVSGLRFALGKALADAGDPAASFRHYAAGNQAVAATLPPGAGRVTQRVDRLTAHFDATLFNRLGGRGHTTTTPIFVVGMHRAGSTLVEQILASHPDVEGTAELPVLPRLWRSLGSDPLATLDTADLEALGQQYLEAVEPYRREGRPHFVDKQPDNWLHVGFIRLILPNATIIDARRHPLASGFSIYRQLFAAGASFSYDLATIGHFYRDYVRWMDHMDKVQPGAVTRLIYEKLVDAPEATIRALLAAAGLPFDPASLDFHRNTRSVATPSAQQVRRPINREGLDGWRPFEPFLGPLRDALGDALDRWDDLPA